MSFRSTKLRFLNLVRLLTAGTIGVLALLPVAAGQTPVTIYNFNGSGDVTTPVPYGVMVQGRDGNIYGTAHEGGAFGGGGVFVVTPAGKESVIFSFPLSYGSSC